MPTCSFRAERNRCWPWHGATSPAPSRRRDRRCRKAKWRMRASSERPRASRLARTVASSLARSLVVGKTLGLDETVCIMPPLCLPTRGPVAGFARRLLAGLVELIQQISETVGDPLTDHVVVYPLQDVPEPSLVFAAQPSSGLSYRGVGLHCRLWRLFCRGFRPNRLAPRRSRPNCLLFVHLNPTRRNALPRVPSVLVKA